MAKEPTKHYNAAGTHVFLRHPETGGEWECPVGVAQTYVDVRGWEYAAPIDHSLDGLFDESSAEGDLQTGFDPAEHTVDEVNAYLEMHAHAAPGEVARVLALEEAGQNRKTVVDPRPKLDDPTNPVAAGDADTPTGD